MVKEFKNGNINIRLEKDEIKQLNINETSEADFWKLYAFVGALLDNIDCDYLGDFYSRGNSCQAIDIYNHRTDRIFTICDYEFYSLSEGLTVKLIGRKPTEDESKILNDWDFD